VLTGAAGTATVNVTANPSVSGPDGLYSGRVTASASGASVLAVPFGLHREPESYELTLRHIDRNGAPAFDYATDLFSLDQVRTWHRFDADGELTIRVPRGTYHFQSVLVTWNAGVPNTALLMHPRVAVTANTVVNVDARLGERLDVTVPRAGARLIGGASPITSSRRACSVLCPPSARSTTILRIWDRLSPAMTLSPTSSSTMPNPERPTISACGVRDFHRTRSTRHLSPGGRGDPDRRGPRHQRRHHVDVQFADDTGGSTKPAAVDVCPVHAGTGRQQPGTIQRGLHLPVGGRAAAAGAGTTGTERGR
jgi:hypothetical protein